MRQATFPSSISGQNQSCLRVCLRVLHQFRHQKAPKSPDRLLRQTEHLYRLCQLHQIRKGKSCFRIGLIQGLSKGMSGIGQSWSEGRTRAVYQVVRRPPEAATRNLRLCRDSPGDSPDRPNSQHHLYLARARQILLEAEEAIESRHPFHLADLHHHLSHIPAQPPPTLPVRLHLEMNSMINRSSTARKTPIAAELKALPNISSIDQSSLLCASIIFWMSLQTYTCIRFTEM